MGDSPHNGLLDSPSRQLISEQSPRNVLLDSPSRQLISELGQLAISTQRELYARLDRESEERESVHTRALQKALRRHERVRRDAQVEVQRVEAEKEAERQRQEEERRRDLERQHYENQLAQEKREAERARIAADREKELARVRKEAQDEADRVQVEKDRLAQREREALEERRKREENAQIEKEKKAEKEKKKKEQEEAEQEAAKAQAKSAAAAAAQKAISSPGSLVKPQTSSSTSTSIPQEWEATHARYLEIHKQLKIMRKAVTSQLQQNASIKAQVGDMRRAIKKSVGQLTGTNRKAPLKTILATLTKSKSSPEPTIDVPLFLAEPPPNVGNLNPKGPLILIYLLNIFSKAVIAQFLDEAGVNPAAADPVGIVGSHIFAVEEYRWQGHSLIDILLAKMHVVAPALFGIYGPEDTAQGKTRLGWWREEKRFEGPFMTSQRHYERMTGLGAGFAALSLRNFEKVVFENPLPCQNYWAALAKIASVPPSKITSTHFVLLKALIENYETKFINFYGGAATAALRLLVVDLPKKCTPSVSSKSLAGLADVMKLEKKILL